MAVEIFPDTQSIGMSPRISFSHDLPQNDIVPVEHYIRSSSSSTIDFDFCVFRESFDQQSSSANELFFDGKILPIEIKKRLSPFPPPPQALQPPPPPRNHEIHENRKPMDEKQNIKTASFWRFKRSTSLNCGSGYASTLCPLPILSRSNSAGSNSSSVKRSNNQKQSFGKNQLPNSSLKQSYQKPPLKKNSYGSYSGGIKINPVLNVPPANMFGFGFIFSGGKDKSKKNCKCLIF